MHPASPSSLPPLSARCTRKLYLRLLHPSAFTHTLLKVRGDNHHRHICCIAHLDPSVLYPIGSRACPPLRTTLRPLHLRVPVSPRIPFQGASPPKITCLPVCLNALPSPFAHRRNPSTPFAIPSRGRVSLALVARLLASDSPPYPRRSCVSIPNQLKHIAHFIPNKTHTPPPHHVEPTRRRGRVPLGHAMPLHDGLSQRSYPMHGRHQPHVPEHR